VSKATVSDVRDLIKFQLHWPIEVSSTSIAGEDKVVIVLKDGGIFVIDVRENSNASI